MKTIILICAILSQFTLSAERKEFKTLSLVDGKEYTSVIVRQVEPDGVRIMHAGGMAKIPYEKLTMGTQAVLGGFNPKAAAEFRKADSAKQRQLIRELALLRKQEKKPAPVKEYANPNKKPKVDPPVDHLSARVTGTRKGGIKTLKIIARAGAKPMKVTVYNIAHTRREKTFLLNAKEVQIINIEVKNDYSVKAWWKTSDADEGEQYTRLVDQEAHNRKTGL